MTIVWLSYPVATDATMPAIAAATAAGELAEDRFAGDFFPIRRPVSGILEVAAGIKRFPVKRFPSFGRGVEYIVVGSVLHFQCNQMERILFWVIANIIVEIQADPTSRNLNRCAAIHRAAVCIEGFKLASWLEQEGTLCFFVLIIGNAIFCFLTVSYIKEDFHGIFRASLIFISIDVMVKHLDGSMRIIYIGRRYRAVAGPSARFKSSLPIW